MKWVVAVMGCFVALACGCTFGAENDEAQQTFDQHVAPVLIRRCLGCHSGADPKGGLDLARQDAALRGGESGAAILPGDADESLLWRRVRDDEMPPEEPLSADEKATLEHWITRGATWGADPLDPFRFTTAQRAGYDWWSLQPVRRPIVPEVRNRDWPRNAIDPFVLAQLEAQGLTPSPEADRRTLIRRLSFDLLGLPPSPEDVTAFLADERPDAYEQLVDRLLASPHYGVRWGRAWLDVARFGESQGFERDKLRENAWPYRDWVIGAFNADLPYDEFIRLQIAGDVLRPGDAQAIVATGFLVAGPYDEVGQQQQSAAMKAVVRQDELEDLVSVVGESFLGLTVHCARCHDHKFDPIRQREYYQLAAALDGVRHGERQVTSEVANLPQSIYAVAPAAPGVSRVLLRGNPATPGEAVAPGGVAALAGVTADFGLPPDAPDAARRTQLAAWIAHPQNPLTARVMVNRLWRHHFGAGLVVTPSDFGYSGGRPTHPELLDYLAAEFVKSGWSVKPMQRLMVTSAAYRQGSIAEWGMRNAESESNINLPHSAFRIPHSVDSDNRLLWRKTPQRLDAESLRDAILAAAGELNPMLGGPGFRDFTTYVHNTQFYEMLDPEGPEYNRRSIYRTWVRSGRSRFLDAFDCPDPSTKTPQRAVTVTPLQALSLLNHSFVLRMSDRLADRLRREAGENVELQIDRAFQLTYSRSPNAEELAAIKPFVEQNGLAELCRVLLNSNEFLYVD